MCKRKPNFIKLYSNVPTFHVDATIKNFEILCDLFGE